MVRVYRNRTSPVGRELDRRICEFNAKKPRLASGKAIVVATFEASDYEQFLKDRVQDVKPQLIVLDSPTQIASSAVVERESSHYVNVCAAVHLCATPVPAIVPSWVTGEELEATTHVLDELRSNK